MLIKAKCSGQLLINDLDCIRATPASQIAAQPDVHETIGSFEDLA